MAALKITAGTKIPLPAQHQIFQWLAEGDNLRLMIMAVNAYLNTTYKINVDPGDGGAPITQLGTVQISDSNSTVTLPFTQS